MNTLKEIIKSNFGFDLPISGGAGNSISNAIFFHKSDAKNYVDMEYYILKCLCQIRNIDWKMNKQELIEADNRKFDRISIETRPKKGHEGETRIESYYFNITEVMPNRKAKPQSFSQEETLKEIKNRMIQLESLNEFNKNCIGLLKNGQLFDDIDLTIEFLDIIYQDESYELFKSMMDNTKKSVMTVLSIIANQLPSETRGL